MGSLVGHTLLGKEEMLLPLKPSPASKVLVTTEATVAWLPLEEGPIPVAMDTKEKGSPEEVQVEEPELMGAMSAEEAGEAVGTPVFTILVPSKIRVVLAEKQRTRAFQRTGKGDRN